VGLASQSNVVVVVIVVASGLVLFDTGVGRLMRWMCPSAVERWFMSFVTTTLSNMQVLVDIAVLVTTTSGLRVGRGAVNRGRLLGD